MSKKTFTAEQVGEALRVLVQWGRSQPTLTPPPSKGAAKK